MSRQSPLNRAIRFATASALLAAVMTSPIRPANAVVATSTSRVDCLRRNFGMPAKAATTNHRPHTPVNSRVVQVKAVSSQQELDLTSDPVPHRTDPLYTSSPEAGQPSTVLGFVQTVHPLRC
jgi:hypothetical protein